MPFYRNSCRSTKIFGATDLASYFWNLITSKGGLEYQIIQLKYFLFFESLYNNKPGPSLYMCQNL